jgi:hypothetical protein
MSTQYQYGFQVGLGWVGLVGALSEPFAHLAQPSGARGQ